LLALAQGKQPRTKVCIETYADRSWTGYRIGRISSKKSKIRFSDVLVYIQGFVSVAFVFAVCINSAGIGLATETQCYNAIRVCIAMYGVGKMAL
jgi:hypothetical protein